jgi:hypothetical protein
MAAPPEDMYHDRTAWSCAFFVGKKYGCSKGCSQRNAAHMGSISLWISFVCEFYFLFAVNWFSLTETCGSSMFEDVSSEGYSRTVMALLIQK